MVSRYSTGDDARKENSKVESEQKSAMTVSDVEARASAAAAAAAEQFFSADLIDKVIYLILFGCDLKIFFDPLAVGNKLFQ